MEASYNDVKGLYNVELTPNEWAYIRRAMDGLLKQTNEIGGIIEVASMVKSIRDVDEG